MIQNQQLKVLWRKKDEGCAKMKQKEERQFISRSLSMAATRASRSKKYSDTDILLDNGSKFSVFKNDHMFTNTVRSRHIMRAMTN